MTNCRVRVPAETVTGTGLGLAILSAADGWIEKSRRFPRSRDFRPKVAEYLKSFIAFLYQIRPVELSGETPSMKFKSAKWNNKRNWNILRRLLFSECFSWKTWTGYITVVAEQAVDGLKSSSSEMKLKLIRL